jgi:predicted DNA-binding transcriptional regulator YafY
VEEHYEKLVVSMQLIPNVDLIRKLASMGNDVTVLAPESLAKEMQVFFKDALSRYEGK